jgi:hypothetical protein
MFMDATPALSPAGEVGAVARLYTGTESDAYGGGGGGAGVVSASASASAASEEDSNAAVGVVTR